MWKSDSIDEKALQAKDNEESSIRALVDEVFGTPEFAIILPEDRPEYREAMKERVLEAELDYRNGLSEGIAEENIVRTVNELADKFNAPDFAQTSALQVRVLRACLIDDYPNFIAQETGREETGMEVTFGDSVSPIMSPLEAVFVTAYMLEQKWLSETYQYAPEEWVDKVYNKAVERWRANLSGNKRDDKQVEYRLELKKNSEKLNQIARIVIDGAATLLSSASQDSSASRNIYDASLDTLGIKRLTDSS